MRIRIRDRNLFDPGWKNSDPGSGTLTKSLQIVKELRSTGNCTLWSSQTCHYLK
jgi:hypothetical protein